MVESRERRRRGRGNGHSIDFRRLMRNLKTRLQVMATCSDLQRLAAMSLFNYTLYLFNYTYSTILIQLYLFNYTILIQLYLFNYTYSTILYLFNYSVINFFVSYRIKSASIFQQNYLVEIVTIGNISNIESNLPNHVDQARKHV